jgi:hypothetical protein
MRAQALDAGHVRRGALLSDYADCEDRNGQTSE